MNFIKKAKQSLAEAQEELTHGVKDLGLNFGDKKHESESAHSTPAMTPATTAASTPAPSVKPNDLKVPHSTAPGAPTKLPLTERKKIRDAFEDKKPALEAEFSKLLGQEWTIYVDTAGVYTYLPQGTHPRDPGVLIYDYFKGALNHLKQFHSKYGAADAASINQYATDRVITLEPTTKQSVSYVDTDFLDGRWRLLFRDTQFGTNAQNAGSNIADVVNAASKSNTAGGAPQMSLAAQKGIRDAYEAKIAAVLQRTQALVNDPALTFQPNFDENYATLSAFAEANPGKLRKDWENTLGPATLDYFSGLPFILNIKKFGSDEMMQEGFKEVVSASKVAFVVTPAVARTHNDTAIEDGVLLIRAKPTSWWTNTNQACDKVDELL